MNIYKILESLQRVEESAMAEADLLLQDLVNGRVDAYDIYAHPKDAIEEYVSGILHKYYENVTIDTGLHADDDVEQILDRALTNIQHDYKIELDEEFTGYWKGTDKGTPGKKMVGASESVETMSPIEKKLRARWEQTKKGLAEYGMTDGGTINSTTTAPNTTAPAGQQTPGQPNQQQPNPADAAKQTAVLQKNLQNLKTQVPNLNINKATQALTKADDGQDLDNQDEKTMAAVAPQIADIVKNPQLAGQFKQLISKSSQQEKQDQQKQQQQQQQQPAGQQQQGTV